MNDLLARVIAAHGGLDTKIIAKSGFHKGNPQMEFVSILIIKSRQQ